MIVGFDEYQLDTDAFELRRCGEIVAVEPQVFDVLAHLVDRAGNLVTKGELLDEVWGDRFVSESALTSRIKAARQAIGDDGQAQRFIKTVHGRGYRFEADVHDVTGPQRSRSRGDAAAAGGHVPTNLPAERTALLGRDDDVSAVGDALTGHRLVTVLGIGGIGKTRLAVAAARAAATQFPDGVWFVDLVPVQPGDGIETALAAASGLRSTSGRARDEVVELLADREVLVVLDNAEHVIDDVAELVEDLLVRTQRVRVLVTSRVPTGIVEERRVAIEPLPVAAVAGSPAVDLFVRSAERVGETVADDDLEVVASICRRLDGLPLAIELAAAQLLHLDLAALADRLDQRFELLDAGSRRGGDRHASLQAVLADGWDALDADQRALLTALSVVPGSFDLDDLGGLAPDVDAGPGRMAGAGRSPERLLRELLDRSLIVREGGGPPHYRILESVRLFARQQSAPEQWESALDAHAEWCLARVAGAIDRWVFDLELANWCAEHEDDLRVAGRHLESQGRLDDAAGLCASTALAMHCDAGPRAAARLRRSHRLLDLVEGDERRTELHVVGVMCGMATRAPEVIDAESAAALAAAERTADPLLRSVCAVLRSWSVIFSDPDAALDLTVRAAGHADEVGNGPARDFADGYRTFVLALMRRYDEAITTARAIIDRAPVDERGNYPTHVAVAALASIAFLSDVDESLPWADRIRDVPSATRPMWSNVLLAAGLYGSAGDVDRCRDLCIGLHARLEQAGADPFPDLLVPIATLAHRLGDHESARRWVTAVRAAARPTQSFQATVMYRRLREAVELAADGDAGEDGPDDPPADIAAIGAEAMSWLADVG